MSPNSGTGISQTFSFAFADPQGYQSLSGVNALINTSTNGLGACWIYYDLSGPTLWLASDDASTWSSAAVGSSSTLQNSQCSINAAGLSGTGSGTSFTIQVPIVFKSGFTGGKTIYLRAIDASGPSSFAPSGSWTVPASAPLGAASVTPNSGAGTTTTFALTLNDPNGYQQLSGGNLLINSSLNGVGACWVYYDAAGNWLWLAHDDTLNWDGAPAGVPGLLANGQCSINPQGVTASGSGSLLTVTIPITFSGSFAGAKSSYGRAIDNGAGASSFTQLGSWTVQ